MQHSKIEYLRGPDGREGFTWNPVKMKCSRISAGCENCWHLAFAKRHAANPNFSLRYQQAYKGEESFLDAFELHEPSNKRKSAIIAVQFMGDLFHESVTDDMLTDVFTEMFLASAANRQAHTFLVLTKRPRRMCEWSRKWVDHFGACLGPECPRIWWGVSVEGACEIERLRFLRATPAAFRWVSFEPLISPVGVDDWDGISWAVIGAETGPHKRPCRQEWIDDLRSQCASAGVKFFGKVDQNGQPVMPRELPRPS